MGKSSRGAGRVVSHSAIMWVLFIGTLGGVTFSLAYVGLPEAMGLSYQANVREGIPDSEHLPTKPEVKHVALPGAVKAVYMSQCVVGTPSFRDDLVALVKETELNALVIDIKDYTGKIAFSTDNPILKESVSDACGASDMREFIERLHSEGVYVIGRITVFQDPFYSLSHPELAVKKESDGSVWKDHKGLSFIDVSARPYWDFVVELSKESFNLGFDELNYDYIRFPSDGNMKDIYFSWSATSTKAQALETFFSYLHERVKDPALYDDFDHVGIEGKVPQMSADLFGMTMTNTDDLNIGQQLERTLPYFDFVAPMVYPSHYPNGFNGWSNPNNVPYELIYFVMKEGRDRSVATTTTVAFAGAQPVSTTTPWIYRKPSFSGEKLRPWLQDFDYGGDYDAQDVRAQIQATYDAGLTSWMLWSPSNRYTKEALLPE
jgi:hypothetical protein